MQGEKFIQRGDCGIDVFALQKIRRKETEDRLAGTVEDDVAIEHLEVDVLGQIGGVQFEAEHQAYAIPFPGLGERFARLEEQLAIITGLWGTKEGETFSFDGVHYTVKDSPGLPKPVQHPRPPVIIGGGGPRRTPRLAALYADEFNRPFATLEVCIES